MCSVLHQSFQSFSVIVTSLVVKILGKCNAYKFDMYNLMLTDTIRKQGATKNMAGQNVL